MLTTPSVSNGTINLRHPAEMESGTIFLRREYKLFSPFLDTRGRGASNRFGVHGDTEPWLPRWNHKLTATGAASGSNRITIIWDGGIGFEGHLLVRATPPVIIIAKTSSIRNKKKSHLFLCTTTINKSEDENQEHYDLNTNNVFF